MKKKELEKKIRSAVHNSKRWNTFGKKEVVEEILVRYIFNIIKRKKKKK